MKELLTPKFKSISVKECAKKFKTNISDENSNFTHEFKEKCIEFDLFFGSKRKIAYKN